jgi:hypothetical protein
MISLFNFHFVGIMLIAMMATDQSVQAEKKKLKLLDSKFYGVTNKMQKAVAAKRRGSRLEAGNTWKVCFYAAKESCSVAGKLFRGGGGAALCKKNLSF